MNKICLVAIACGLIVPCCRKSSSGDNEVLGSWKLTLVYDKTTAMTSFATGGSSKDVIISFLNGHKFTGHTLVNTFSDGIFSQNGNEITFGNFSMTKVAEDPWGGSFLAVLTACQYTSVTPCAPSAIAIQGKIMKITSPLRYDITLEKL